MSTGGSDESGDNDVFTSDEEQMIEKMQNLRMSKRNGGRRLSSLDMFLMQPQPEPETYVLKSKEKLIDVIESVKIMEEEMADEKIEEKRRIESERKRLEILEARMERNEIRHRESVLRDFAEKRKSIIVLRRARRGLGGLTREKRSLLKQLLLQKAKDEMHNEQKEMLRAREEYLKTVCKPLSTEGMDDAQLRSYVKDLYSRALSLEVEKIDWEEKVRCQEDEINQLVQNVQEQKGRFALPVLKKVRRKTSKRERLQKLKEIALLNGSHITSAVGEANSTTTIPNASPTTTDH